LIWLQLKIPSSRQLTITEGGFNPIQEIARTNLAEASYSRQKNRPEEFRIESRVLDTPEASAVIITNRNCNRPIGNTRPYILMKTHFQRPGKKPGSTKTACFGGIASPVQGDTCWIGRQPCAPLSANRNASITTCMPSSFHLPERREASQFSSSALTRIILRIPLKRL